jgi:hypothetical protein
MSSTTFSITMPMPTIAGGVDKRQNHIRTIFACAGIVVSEFHPFAPFNKDGRDLVTFRFDGRMELTTDRDHREHYRLSDDREEIRGRIEAAEHVIGRVNEFAEAQSEHYAKPPSERGELSVRPLEMTYDTQDHYWKVYKFVEKKSSPAAAVAASAAKRPIPKLR